MTPLVPVSTWTCEDDELLKNATEAGTSFESLSKGAVQFSQRFTVDQEIKCHTCHENVSLEQSSHDIECVDSTTTLLPKVPILEHKGEKSIHQMNDGVSDDFSPMLKRVKSYGVEEEDNVPQYTDYMHGEAKQNHLGSPVSNCESEHQHLPNLETVSAGAAIPTNFTQEEDIHSLTPEVDRPSEMLMRELYDNFYFEAETSFIFDETYFANDDNDVSKTGDSSTLPEIPVEDIYISIPELTFPELQVEEKESAANSADSHSAGDANNLEFLGCDVHSDVTDHIPCHNMENLGQSTYGNLAGSSGSPMGFRELEEFYFSDDDGNNADTIPDLDSLLLEFNWEESMADFEVSIIAGGGACSGEPVKDGQFMNCFSESPMLAPSPAANPEIPTCISDIHVLPSASNPEVHIACAPQAHLSANSVVHISCIPEAQILPSKPNVDPDFPQLCNGVICCVVNTQDTEIPCNDNVRRRRRRRRRLRRLSASKNKSHQRTGLRGMYITEALKGKPDSCETIQSEKTLYVADSKEKPESSETMQSEILS